ncbi:MAG: hypothetical protein SWJ54_01550 [Cyanobacteriota bacterium]|nr:hypothetical protein [Cyanobacteriota bacterium]
MREVARRIESISDSRVQSNIGASAFILAGLVLESETIQSILRRDIMEESTTYQALRREAREEGLQEGRLEGIQQVALNLLRSGMSLEQVASFTGLSVEQLTQLSLNSDNSNPSEPPTLSNNE